MSLIHFIDDGVVACKPTGNNGMIMTKEREQVTCRLCQEWMKHNDDGNPLSEPLQESSERDRDGPADGIYHWHPDSSTSTACGKVLLCGMWSSSLLERVTCSECLSAASQRNREPLQESSEWTPVREAAKAWADDPNKIVLRHPPSILREQRRWELAKELYVADWKDTLKASNAEERIYDDVFLAERALLCVNAADALLKALEKPE